MDIFPPSESASFENLIYRAQACRLCPEMGDCQRVLSDANGPGDAKVMFIGEAPGRLGAERTAVPFHGDVAGDNFEKLLTLAGMRRSEVFVTNSILCNPTDQKGNNAPPSRASIRNCSRLLAQQIEVINPDLIVTLGAAALSALSLISEHRLTVSKDVRTISEWNGRKLVPLYHPGARAMIHRSFPTQTADYYFIGETVRRMGSKRSRAIKEPSDRAGWQIVRYVLSKIHVLSLFKLHKIMYLLDYAAVSRSNKRITDFFYIRQKDGPYCVELGSKWYKKFENLEVSYRADVPILTWRGTDLFDGASELGGDERIFVDRLLEPLSGLTESQLKTRAYLTAPMKRALHAERNGLVGLNRALF